MLYQIKHCVINMCKKMLPCGQIGVMCQRRRAVKLDLHLFLSMRANLWDEQQRMVKRSGLLWLRSVGGQQMGTTSLKSDISKNAQSQEVNCVSLPVFHSKLNTRKTLKAVIKSEQTVMKANVIKHSI